MGPAIRATVIAAATVVAIGAGCGGDEGAAPAQTASPTTEQTTATTGGATTTRSATVPAVDLDGLAASDARLIADFTSWQRLRTPPAPALRDLGSAHSGTKTIYAGPAETAGERRPYPAGTVVVKQIDGASETQIAIMEKVAATDPTTGGWRYVEYERADGAAAFTKLTVPSSLCSSCHMRAAATDWVFTTR